MKVLYFAAVKDITGKEMEEVEIRKEDYTLQTLSADLCMKYGEKLKTLLESCLFAVDMEYIQKKDELETLLKDASEVAIIPPVSGG
ncbi:MoaD/ThiS [Rhizopus microsporus var. microsporus]|uniref:MoaD/ThiS n=2 Tax=Rhizopus microsporus TaxID=58291 RepID=A0A2G4SZL2_RHIZD|nr:MoaD/ThiS [Rhizopus microsporus ATCC 52813]ORE12123.1 MoaD/ThiS [Rhizopus microsporus var. microsporus]PHZ14187.1 MoaD/ThiS [Rhizopus microsporus ATCC 52813]